MKKDISCVTITVVANGYTVEETPKGSVDRNYYCMPTLRVFSTLEELSNWLDEGLAHPAEGEDKFVLNGPSQPPK